MTRSKYLRFGFVLSLFRAFVILFLCVPAEAAPPDWANHPENQWLKQSPREGAPAPRFGWEGSGSYDPYSKKWIHHAGHDGNPQGFLLFTCDLDTGIWEQRFPPTSPPGVCCVDGANVFDLVNRRFVRFPGGSLGHGYQWSRNVKLKNSAVWLYDTATNTWTNMRPPPYAKPLNARDGLGQLNGGGAYDAKRGLALSFGGQNSAGSTNNLFVYDAYANQLQRLDASNPPSHRDGMGVCYDDKHDCLVMFGSQYGNDEMTWTYRYAANRWEAHDLDPHPPGKKLGTYSTIPKLAYDSRNGVCLCVTWDTNSNEHQTWVFDTGKRQWTKMNPPVEPEASMSRSRNLSYSAEHNAFILELTPKESKGNGVQLWTYCYRKAGAQPTPPRDLQVVTAAEQATLNWKTSAKEAQVWRGEGPEAWKLQLEPLATVQGTTFVDKGLQPGKVYHYVVKADSVASFPARTQPRVPAQPVVSLHKDKVALAWTAHPATDVVGYNVYRGLVSVQTVKKGTPSAWKDNDPEYAEPLPVEVRDITDIRKLNDSPLSQTSFSDALDLTKPGPESGDYRFRVFAYLIRAVNRLGTESGPSPYALTLPSAPTNVFNRERGELAELKWDANPETSIAGYHVYKLEGTWNIVRVTDQPIAATTFTHKGGKGTTRYWVVAVDALGQEGEPSSPVWHNKRYDGFFQGEWHQ